MSHEEDITFFKYKYLNQFWYLRNGISSGIRRNVHKVMFWTTWKSIFQALSRIKERTYSNITKQNKNS